MKQKAKKANATKKKPEPVTLRLTVTIDKRQACTNPKKVWWDARDAAGDQIWRKIEKIWEINK